MAASSDAELFVRATVVREEMLVPHYLLHSYLYYVLNRPMISDYLYDHICRELGSVWHTVQHPHKRLIDRSALSAGTGYHLKYTSMIEGAADRFLHEFDDNLLPRRRASRNVHTPDLFGSIEEL